ncbi:MAG: esterase-like activity of phytase family protein [Hyphomonadaceae bacterium]
MMRFAPSALLSLALLAACSQSAADAPIADQWRAVEVTATPVEFGAERVGALIFRGGVELRSEDVAFGGLSGLEIIEDNRLIAISDDGHWFEGRLSLDENGALIGVADMRVALMRGEDGEPFANKRAGDSEGLAQLPDGRFAVSFEQTQTLRIYDLNRDGPFGAAHAGPRLADVRRLPDNAGLEALAASETGALLVGAEGGGGETTLWLAPLDANGPAPPIAHYALAPGFSLTSLDRLPSGGFVALERFYAPVIGPRARVTRFSEDAVRARNGEVDADLLALIEPPLALDNFEGVAAVARSDGGVRLYIVSDNNFRDSQRTLLLAFDVAE